MIRKAGCKPQGLKPAFLLTSSGTAEAVPFPKLLMIKLSDVCCLEVLGLKS